MLEVFKSNITKKKQAKEFKKECLTKCPDYLIAFDLEDCDKIIRIEGENLNIKDIMEIAHGLNIALQILE
jgi:hypothetical protein